MSFLDLRSLLSTLSWQPWARYLSTVLDVTKNGFVFHTTWAHVVCSSYITSLLLSKHVLEPRDATYRCNLDVSGEPNFTLTTNDDQHKLWYFTHRLWIGEWPKSIVIFLTGRVPQTKVNGSTIDHNICRVIVKSVGATHKYLSNEWTNPTAQQYVNTCQSQKIYHYMHKCN